MYAKDPYEAKYQLLINKRETTGLKYFNDSEAFIEHSNDMDDIYKNVEDYNPNKKRKMLVVFDDMIADMLKLNPTVTELFIRGRKLNISLTFTTQSYFAVSTQYFVMKIQNKRELQVIAFNHLSDIKFQDFMNLYKSVLQNDIRFWLLILLLHKIILHVLERIF